MDNMVMIAATYAKAAAIGGTTLEEIVELAMNEMRTFWGSTDDDLRFRGAVGGAMLVLKEKGMDEEYERLDHEMQMLRALSAAITTPGVSLNSSMFEDAEDFEPIGLMGRWRDGETHHKP